MRVENGRIAWSALGAPTIMFGDDGAGSSPAMLDTIRDNSYPYGATYLFGLRFTADSLRVYNIMMRHGATFIQESTGYKDVTITTDYDWVVARYSMTGESWTLVRVAGAAGGAIPVDPDDETISIPVCQCRFADGTASLHLYVATMPAPAMFAPLEE